MEAAKICCSQSYLILNYLLRGRLSAADVAAADFLLSASGSLSGLERADLETGDLGVDSAGKFKYLLCAHHALFVLFPGEFVGEALGDMEI